MRDLNGYGFWLLASGYALVPLLLAFAHSVLGVEPGKLMYRFQGFALGLAVMFFIIGCLAEAL
jgi:hypothetical protein